jgi:uncharacterized SAM-binding protein YcdF (DUF218 family)
MRRVRRALPSLLTVALAALIAGFYVFAARLETYGTIAHGAAGAGADAVVVLTGGEDRITAGIELVEKRPGQRLLISGVNPRITSVADLARHLGGHDRVLKCCVDLGHHARDTTGNAEEARDWARAKGYRSLVIVTSSYHMPRSLTEFAIAMPNVALVPHPVPSRHYHLDAWWRHFPTARLLAGEYLKYITSLARYTILHGVPLSKPPTATGHDASPFLSSI